MPEGALGIETCKEGHGLRLRPDLKPAEEVGNPDLYRRGCLSGAMDHAVRGYPTMIGCQGVCSIDLAAIYPPERALWIGR